MMMDEVQESRFVCKLCNKKFSSGKSLGGHMRSHVVSNSSGKAMVNQKEPKLDEYANGQSGYGLRENPKKTWRAVDAKVDRVCKQCGKGFQSLKALCGHMACHSERDRGLKDDDHFWDGENPKMVMDSCSDTEERRMLGLIGSSSKRYKNVVLDECLMNSLANNNNESSSVSEIDGQEDVEIAVCLMLLSMDSGNKCGVNSGVEDSDNNSVVLETKSSSFDGNRESLDHIRSQDEMKKLRHLIDGKIARMEDSDSGYFLDECGKAESDVSVDAFRECKNKHVVNVKGRRAEGNADHVESLKVIKTRTSHSVEENDCAMTGARKRKRSGSEYLDLWNESARAIENGTHNVKLCNNSLKKSTYDCSFNGKKVFRSDRGGNEAYKSRYGSRENSLDGSIEAAKVVESSKNRKASVRNSPGHTGKAIKLIKKEGHVCPFCNKVFKNGQALGGHKRSHLVVGREENSCSSPIVKRELPALLDLNLPAPEADDELN